MIVGKQLNVTKHWCAIWRVYILKRKKSKKAKAQFKKGGIAEYFPYSNLRLLLLQTAGHDILVRARLA